MPPYVAWALYKYCKIIQLYLLHRISYLYCNVSIFLVLMDNNSPLRTNPLFPLSLSSQHLLEFYFEFYTSFIQYIRYLNLN